MTEPDPSQGHSGGASGDKWSSAPSRGALTLGEVIDGYIHLSADSQRRFQALFELCPMDGAAPQTSGAGSSTGPGTLQNDGVTVRPSDGVVFKAQPPRRRRPEFLALEAAETAACSTLAEYTRGHGWYVHRIVNDDVVLTSTVDIGGEEIVGDARLEELKEALSARKADVKAYKEAHPEEFRAPKSGKSGNPDIPRGGRGGPRGGRGGRGGFGRGGAGVGIQW